MKVGICGYYGEKNIGDEIILQILQDLVRRVFPRAEITVFGKGNLFPFGLRSFFKAFFTPQLWKKPLAELRSCDIFILGGGGLFSHEEGFFIPIFWALHGAMALLLKKPLVCIGLSIGPLKPLHVWILKKVFSQAKFIVVRDKASQDLLKNLGIDSFLGCDLAMFYKIKITPKLKIEKPYIILSVRPFKNTPENLYTILAQLCDSIIEKYGFLIRFIPFQKGALFDSKILNTIFDRVQNKSSVILDQFYENIDELIEVLQGAEAGICMRLHAGILCFLAETPFIPLSYMRKVKDFWQEFSEITLVVMETMNLSSLTALFEEIFGKSRKNQNIFKPMKQKFSKRVADTEKYIISSLKNL